VIALTQSAALEYGPILRVNCVSPGLIETPLTQPLLRDEKARAAMEQRTPLGRIGTVEDVAAVIAFLCSEIASYVTGVNIAVDGGSLLPSSQVEDELFGFIDEGQDSR
jgi:NAD(P)-dependent dehydrogenase (short-subunit alcohol dehydrogenase family)